MNVKEMYRCKGKAGFIDGIPFGSDTSITGRVQCMGFTDYVHVNEINGEMKRVCQVAIRYRFNENYMRTCFIDIKHVRLLDE